MYVACAFVREKAGLSTNLKRGADF